MLLINRRHLLGAGAVLPLAVAPSGAFAFRPGLADLRLRPTVHDGSEQWPLENRMDHHGVPGAAVAILRGGRLWAVHGFGSCIAGRAAAVGADTLFSVGSVSKIVTAALALKLVADGKLELDRDVNLSLERWRVPPAPDGSDSAITLRMLLSHTAGFNVHGFADFAPSTLLPTALETLNGEPPALNKPLVRIDRAGMRSRYSGGGYMVVQTLIEDVIGAAFATIAEQYVFTPLGMTRSRFDAAPSADTDNIAHAHDGQGRPVALPRGWQSFPELAPSGLWTTAHDLSRFVLALGQSYHGTKSFLPQALAIEMMTPVAPSIHGLGPRLTGDGQSRIFHHGGANDSYKAYIEGNLANGDGLIILTNGANGDVLGDEIRNAISDRLQWPGIWAATTTSVSRSRTGMRSAGSYRLFN